MEFEGIDWRELADYLGVEIDPNAHINDEINPLIKYIENTCCGFDKDLEVIKACREYLSALISSCDGRLYVCPLWEGLSKIEDNEVFIINFIILLPGMWF